MLLSKLGNEILSRGPEAVLPQNLSPEWLGQIQKMADEFLDTNFEGDQCRKVDFTADPVLSACVLEILRHLKDGEADVQENEMFEKLTLYALSVTVETVTKQIDIDLEPPTLTTIFDKRRLRKIVNIRPEFESIIKIVCVEEAENPRQK
ncbi:MAG: hypothetical protein ACWGNK_01340 [Desulfobacterales bacterium]